MTPKAKAEAIKLLKSLGAPRQLLLHVELVGEVAELLLDKFDERAIAIDGEFVRAGVVIHDVGKVVHERELSEPGSDHEEEGEKLLLAEGVSPELARCCLSHARWAEMECSTEELLVALSDKLWKGQRSRDLELLIIDRAAKHLDQDRWDLFAELDGWFEEIANDGDERIVRSRL